MVVCSVDNLFVFSRFNVANRRLCTDKIVWITLSVVDTITDVAVKVEVGPTRTVTVAAGMDRKDEQMGVAWMTLRMFTTAATLEHAAGPRVLGFRSMGAGEDQVGVIGRSQGTP